jgi:hypothetical protein
LSVQPLVPRAIARTTPPAARSSSVTEPPAAVLDARPVRRVLGLTADVDVFTGETLVLITRGSASTRGVAGTVHSQWTSPCEWPSDQTLVTGLWVDLVTAALAELVGGEEF